MTRSRVMDATSASDWERFGLTLHPDKTRLLPFRRPPSGQQSGKGPATFDFLGFTFYWARTRKGRWGMLCKTRSASLRRIIGSVYDWCRRHRHLFSRGSAQSAQEAYPGPLQLLRRQRQLSKSAARHRTGEAGIWYKWLCRRSQRKRLTWISLSGCASSEG